MKPMYRRVMYFLTWPFGLGMYLLYQLQAEGTVSSTVFRVLIYSTVIYVMCILIIEIVLKNESSS